MNNVFITFFKHVIHYWLSRSFTAKLFLAFLALLLCALNSNALSLARMSYEGGYAVRNDAGSIVNEPHWSPTSSWPYLYIRNSRLAVWLFLNIEANQQEYRLQIQGLAPYGLVLMSPERIVPISDAARENYFQLNSGDVVLLPDTTLKSEFSIVWQYRTRPNEESQWSAWSTFGTTTTPLYLCLAAPADTDKLYRTVVDNACANGGAKNPVTAASNIWTRFLSRNVRTWSNQPLYYYRANTTFDQNAKASVLDLLNNTNRTGECGAWADFLGECLHVHGITDWKAVIVSPNKNPYLLDQGLVVNKWNEDGNGTQPSPYKWQIKFTPTNKIDMVPVPSGSDYGDLSGDSGTAGQGSPTPSQKVFNVHYILRYGTNKWYDPSYAFTYTSENNMESTAMHGFFSRQAEGPTGFHVDVRRAGAYGIHFSEQP